MIEQLNSNHAIEGNIRFIEGEGGLPTAVIENAHAHAKVTLHGAHVTHFQPHNQAPILWMSSQAQYRSDKALRGGIPVIWPWFGPHPTDDTKPQHGFARVSAWSVLRTEALPNGETQLALGLSDNETTRSIWPYSFELEIVITVGGSLQVDLTCRNTGAQKFDAGAALHTYFTVGHIDSVHLEGLDGRPYLDKVTGYDRKVQSGDIRFTQEVDRIYLDTDDMVTIHDAKLARQIHVSKSGSLSTVVWNPWEDRAKTIGDFPDDGYETMVCVETTNAAEDTRTIDPGANHTLTQIIRAA